MAESRDLEQDAGLAARPGRWSAELAAGRSAALGQEPEGREQVEPGEGASRLPGEAGPALVPGAEAADGQAAAVAGPRAAGHGRTVEWASRKRDQVPRP